VFGAEKDHTAAEVAFFIHQVHKAVSADIKIVRNVAI